MKHQQSTATKSKHQTNNNNTTNNASSQQQEKQTTTVKLGNFNFESPHSTPSQNVDLSDMYSVEDLEREFLNANSKSSTAADSSSQPQQKTSKQFDAQAALSFLNSMYQESIQSGNYKQFNTDSV